MADHAFFYFRDPTYARSLPEEQRHAFTNPGTTAEGKCAALKERIRQQCRDGKLKVMPRENYQNPEDLDRLILEDFTQLINTLFPEDQKLDLLDREAADHEAFAQSRAHVYIGRPEYFNWLDAHIASSDPPLVCWANPALASPPYWPTGSLKTEGNIPTISPPFISSAARRTVQTLSVCCTGSCWN